MSYTDRPEKVEMKFEWNWPSSGYSDGFTIFCLDIDLRLRGDHSPGAHVLFVIFNFKLLDFGYYNIHHAPDEPDPEFGVISPYDDFIIR